MEKISTGNFLLIKLSLSFPTFFEVNDFKLCLCCCFSNEDEHIVSVVSVSAHMQTTLLYFSVTFEHYIISEKVTYNIYYYHSQTQRELFLFKKIFYTTLLKYMEVCAIPLALSTVVMCFKRTANYISEHTLEEH